MPTLSLALAIIAAIISLTLPHSATAQTNDPAAVLQALDAAILARDVDAALALFADTAVVKDGDAGPGQTGNYVGKDEIRAWLTVLVNPALEFNVRSMNHQVSGDVVTWSWEVSVAPFKQLGIDPEPGTGAALVQGGKIQFYSIAATAEWRAKFFAATALPAQLPKTSETSENRIWHYILAGCGLLVLGIATLRRQRRNRALNG